VGEPGPDRPLVIIPAFNEEAALPGVLADLRAVDPPLDIVVIDDGSSDGTAEVARAAGTTVVQLPFNMGIGGALRTGFLYAVRHGYDQAVQFDGDGQHDPSQIARLLDALDEGADMVVGSRFADETQVYDVGRVRAGAMSMLRFMVRHLSGQSFTDTSSGFRAFSRPVLELFARNYPYEYMESVEALVLAVSSGFTVSEIPVRMHQRQQGAPSNVRLKLLYHYVRLMLTITVSATRRRSLQKEAP
jgi:glycosyltransferase involved in cell wall biosynthesis